MLLEESEEKGAGRKVVPPRPLVIETYNLPLRAYDPLPSFYSVM